MICFSLHNFLNDSSLRICENNGAEDSKIRAHLRGVNRFDRPRAEDQDKI